MKKVMFAFLVVALLVGAIGIVSAAEKVNPKDYKALVKIQEKAEDRLADAIKNHRALNVSGRNVSIRESSEGKNRTEIIIGKINAKTGLNLTAADIDGKGKLALKAYLSNGRWAEVKVMPDTASARALAVLKAKCAERNCTIELKEVKIGKNNNSILAYEVTTEKGSKLFGFIKKKMKVSAQVDAETGLVVSEKKPWWASMSRETDETPDVTETPENSGANTMIENTTAQNDTSTAA